MDDDAAVLGAALPIAKNAGAHALLAFPPHAANLSLLAQALGHMRAPCAAVAAGTTVGRNGRATIAAVLREEARTHDNGEWHVGTAAVAHLWAMPDARPHDDADGLAYTQILAVVDVQDRRRDNAAGCAPEDDVRPGPAKKALRALLPPAKAVAPSALVRRARDVLSPVYATAPSADFYLDAELQERADALLGRIAAWIDGETSLDVSSLVFAGAGRAGACAHIMHALSLGDARWLPASISVDAPRAMSRPLALYASAATSNMHRVVNAAEAGTWGARSWLSAEAPRLSAELPADAGGPASWAHAGAEVLVSSGRTRACRGGTSSLSPNTNDLVWVSVAIVLSLSVVCGLVVLGMPDAVAVAASAGGKIKHELTMSLGGRGVALLALLLCAGIAAVTWVDRLVARADDPEGSTEKLRISAEKDDNGSYFRSAEHPAFCAPAADPVSQSAGDGVLQIVGVASLALLVHVLVSLGIESGSAAAAVRIAAFPALLTSLLFGALAL